MSRILLAAILALPLAACQPAGSGAPKVDAAWARLPAVDGRPGAAYFTIRGGSADDALVAIDSAVVERIELHESMGAAGHGGMTTMKPLAHVPVPAGATVAFAPDGRHAMLFGIDRRITPGTEIPLAFRFESGAAVEVGAKSIAAGDPAPAP